MLHEWNTTSLELEQRVLLRPRAHTLDGKQYPEWTAGIVTGIKVNQHSHDRNPERDCGNRDYTVTGYGGHDSRPAQWSRCQTWMVPADSTGRWVGQEIASRAELQLCWYDNVTAEPEGVEGGIVILSHEEAEGRAGSEPGLARLERPDTTLLATVTLSNFLEWSVLPYTG